MSMLLKIVHDGTFAKEEFECDAVSGLYDSLMSIATTYEIHGSGSEMESRAAAAAAQNQDAQASPVGAKDWAQMILDMNPNFAIGSSTKEEVSSLMASLASIVASYNDRPDVQATADGCQATGKKRRLSKGDEDGDDLGILVGEKKRKAIEDLLLRSSPTFWSIVDNHLDAVPFKFSAFSEKIFQIRNLWVGSEINSDPGTISENTPADGEPSVIVDWKLPLSTQAHEALGKRIASDYMRSTAVVTNPEKKKQFRKNQAPPCCSSKTLSWYTVAESCEAPRGYYTHLRP